MAQCMDMAQQDWDVGIEGIGLETAVQQWEERPKAIKPIDKEWRTAAGQKIRRKAQTPPAEPIDGADNGEAEVNEDSDDGSKVDSDTENGFAQFPESQADTDGWADDDEENTKPGDGGARTEEQAEGATVRRTEARCRNNHEGERGSLREQSGVAEQCRSFEDRQGNTTGAHQGNPLSGANQGSQVSADRNRRRSNKRARMEMHSGSYQYQGELQLFVGGDPQGTNRAVPWDYPDRPRTERLEAKGQREITQ